MSKYEKMEAFKLNSNELWEHPNKLLLLDQIVKQQGFSGPTDIPRLSYLSLLTGMTQHPVSMVIKGPSGAGKSYGLNKGKQFIPETAYEQFEGMSEKALVYLKDLSLKNKHLIIGEAAGMAEGNGRTLLRQLLSEGTVRYATVQSTSKGLEGSELPQLEGPTGLIMTTTAPNLHPEDASRMLQVTVKESPDQTLAALLSQALGKNKTKAKIDLSNWHEMYSVLVANQKEVLIPYAEKIAHRLPRSHDRIKRDFKQLLSLIDIHALLHQTNREVDADDRVIANEADYSIIYEILNEPLSEGLDASVTNGIRSVVEGVSEILIKSRKSITVSQAELAKHLKRERGVVSRYVKGAITAGYLKDENPGQGRTAALSIGEVELPGDKVLPSPGKLFGKESNSEEPEISDKSSSIEPASAKKELRASSGGLDVKNWKKATPWE